MLQQTIQHPHGISTFGTCVVRVDPDYATIEFTVMRVEPTPEDAARSVRGTSQALQRSIKASGVPERKIRTSHLELDALSDAGATRYRAEIRFNVTIDEVEAVDTIVVTALKSGANRVDDITYRTSRLREARAEARQGAFLAGLKKAEMYAEAAGVKVGRTIHIEELDPDDIAANLDEIDEFQTSGGINPGSIAVCAAVRVSFTLKGGQTAAATGQYISFDP